MPHTQVPFRHPEVLHTRSCACHELQNHDPCTRQDCHEGEHRAHHVCHKDVDTCIQGRGDQGKWGQNGEFKYI